MTDDWKTLLGGGSFFEAPRWRGDRWYVADFYRYGVYEVSIDGKETEVMHVEGQPSGIGWLPDGSMLVVSKQLHKVFRRTGNGEITTHTDLSGFEESDLNDMVVSSSGHAYLGAFGFDVMGESPEPIPGPIFHITPDGGLVEKQGEVEFPNGMVITPDGRTLIVAESYGCRLSAFDIGDDGKLSNQRVWGQISPKPERQPLMDYIDEMEIGLDGCALDAEGCVWAADFKSGRVARIAPGGEIVAEIAAPDETGIIACMLGGPGRRTLLACAGPLEWNEHIRSKTRDGVLLVTQVDVPGAGLP